MFIVQGDNINSKRPHLPRDTFCGKRPSATLLLVEFQSNLCTNNIHTFHLWKCRYKCLTEACGCRCTRQKFCGCGQTLGTSANEKKTFHKNLASCDNYYKVNEYECIINYSITYNIWSLKLLFDQVLKI